MHRHSVSITSNNMRIELEKKTCASNDVTQPVLYGPSPLTTVETQIEWKEPHGDSLEIQSGANSWCKIKNPEACAEWAFDSLDVVVQWRVSALFKVVARKLLSLLCWIAHEGKELCGCRNCFNRREIKSVFGRAKYSKIEKWREYTWKAFVWCTCGVLLLKCNTLMCQLRHLSLCSLIWM